MQLNRRTLILVGILGIILMVVGQAITLASPTIDEGGQELADWLAGNRSLAILALYLLGLGSVLIVPLALIIRQRLLAAEGSPGYLANTFILAYVATLALIGAALSAYAAAIYRADTLSPGAAELLLDVTWLTISLAAFPTALALASASIVIIQSRALSPMLGYFGLLAAAVHLLSAAAFDTGQGFDPQTMGGVAAVCFYVWAIAAGVLLLRQQEEATVVGIAAAAVIGRIDTLSVAAEDVLGGTGESARQPN